MEHTDLEILKSFWCYRGRRNVVVCHFNDEGRDMVVYRWFAKFKGYWIHEVEYKSILLNGKYYFKSKHLYNKSQQQ